MLQIILPSTNLAQRRNQWMLILSFLHVNIQTHLDDRRGLHTLWHLQTESNSYCSFNTSDTCTFGLCDMTIYLSCEEILLRHKSHSLWQYSLLLGQRSSTLHGYRQEICMTATQTNMADSEHDRRTPTIQDKTKEVPKKGATSVWVWVGKVWHGPKNLPILGLYLFYLQLQLKSVVYYLFIIL